MDHPHFFLAFRLSLILGKSNTKALPVANV